MSRRLDIALQSLVLAALGLLCVQSAFAQGMDSGAGAPDVEIGDAGTSTTGVPHCIPGQASACTCTNGRPGAQTCKDDGTFASCLCKAGTSTTPDAGPADTGMPPGCVDYAGMPCKPVACQGALCDTTNASCGAVAGQGSPRQVNQAPLLILLVALGLGLALARRRHRRRER